MIYKTKDFEQMENRRRAQFFNSLNGFKSASLIGTASKIGNHNLAIFNSVIHIGANPPLMGFILRPTTVERHTYENLLETGQFTINHIHEGIYKKAHHTAANYIKGVSEFEASQLTAEILEGWQAPFVSESTIQIGLEYVSEHLIQENQTRLIIGRVKTVQLKGDYLLEDGSVDLALAKGVTISGLDTYLSVNKLEKLPYAKPKANF